VRNVETAHVDPQRWTAFASNYRKRSPQTASYSTEAVDLLLKAATELHGERPFTSSRRPTDWTSAGGFDGVLNPVIVLPSEVSAKVVARLKVMADLLTYRTDVPQEGRIRGEAGAVEMRLSTFPHALWREGGGPCLRRVGSLSQAWRISGFRRRWNRPLHRLLGATSGAGDLLRPGGQR